VFSIDRLKQLDIGCGERNLICTGASGSNPTLPPASGRRERDLSWTFNGDVAKMHVSFIFVLISGINRNNATSIKILILTGSSASKVKFCNDCSI
jgi:hypothetical protein